MTVPAVIVQGQTLSENGPSATIGGNNVIYSAGFIHVGTYAAPAPSLIPQQLQTASALQVVDGLTISPIPASSAQSDATPITVAVQTAAAGTNDEVIIDSHTVLAGDSPITVSGRPVSLGSAGLVVGTVTYNLPPSSSGLRQLPVTTIDGHTIQSRPGGAIAVDGMSLSAGGPPITVSGTPVSLGSEGLVVGTATYTLSPSLAGSEESPIATIDGQTIQSGPDGAIKIDGMSLSAGGPPITISGTPISLGLSSLAIGTNVVPLPTSSNGGGLGEIILSGLGPVGPTVTSTSANSSVNVQMFTGSQDKVDIPSPAQLLFANACLVVLGMFI
ncbi:MAG: hypothetical protein M1830_010245 [Pleopsidium flavum]|nr:MAG: hypothetical protein M1830_010245 [Pleopsidium flavum]